MGFLQLGSKPVPFDGERPIPKTDAEEARLLAAFDKGEVKSVATKAELAKFKAAARTTVLKDQTRSPRTLPLPKLP